MQYIVLDMEWNQPWPGSYAAKKVLPVEIHGEISQIGAVRLLENGTVADEFQVLVCPKYYKKLNSRVSRLTGLRDATLRDEGLPFPEALARFRSWIGGECIFLTWGFDDIRILEDNILLHDDEPDWITQWYNAQMIFNAQTGTGSAQKALSTAMEMLGIEPSRPAHDALGDAYHTALICSRLDLPRGLAEYAQARRSPTAGLHGAPPGGRARGPRGAGHGLAVIPHKLLRPREERIVMVIADGRAEAGDLQERGHEVAAIDKVVVRADIAVPAAAAGRLHIPDGACIH